VAVASIAALAAGCFGAARPERPPIRSAALDLEESSQKHYLHGRLEQAIELERRAVTSYRSVDDTLALAGALNRLGNLLARSGDSTAARAAYLEALSIARSASHRGEAAAAESNLGALDEASSDFEQAAAHYATAETLAREAEDGAVLATVLNNQGVLARRRGDLARARDLFVAALEIDRANHDRAGEATRLRNIGGLEDAAGRHEEALRAFDEALAIDRARENVTAIALDLVGVSEARARAGSDLETAINERKRARDIHQILRELDEIAHDTAAIESWCRELSGAGRGLPPECSSTPAGSAPAALPQ
jgi:tetratricopeptide (TPR) repeat protein